MTDRNDWAPNWANNGRGTTPRGRRAQPTTIDELHHRADDLHLKLRRRACWCPEWMRADYRGPRG